MAFWKRRSQSFEPVSPQTRYTVTYLGHEEMQGKVGLDNTLKPVDDMYRQYKAHKSKTVSKMDIEVMNNGIKVELLDAGVKSMFVNSPYFLAEGPFGSVFFPINKLSFGAADPYHNKIFCFVSRNENPATDHYWDCHAVFCESSAMAKNLTLYLVKAFQKTTPSKDDPLATAQKSRRPTTVHILREKGTSEHQIHARRKKNPPVSTVSVTLNVDGKKDFGEKDYGNCNKAVADIMAQRAQRELAGVDSDLSNGNNVSKGVGTRNFDKENDFMEGILSDDDMTQNTTSREVPVALNPNLNSPPESPRKSTSPRGDRISSGEDDDVVFTLDPRSGERSPKDMITTMSPPDTPGYLSKEGNSPSPNLTYTPTKPPSPRQQINSLKVQAPSAPQKSVTPENVLPRKLDSPIEVVSRRKAHSPSSPPKSTNTKPESPRQLNNIRDVSKRQQARSASPNSQRKEGTTLADSVHRSTPSPTSPKTSSNALPGSPSNVPSPASKPSPPQKEDGTSGITTPEVSLRRRSPQSTFSPGTSGVNADDSVAVQKKSRKERKSVRFASEEVLIG